MYILCTAGPAKIDAKINTGSVKPADGVVMTALNRHVSRLSTSVTLPMSRQRLLR